MVKYAYSRPHVAPMRDLGSRDRVAPYSRSQFDSLFVYGNYDPETDSGVSATPGLGSKGFEFTNCKVRASEPGLLSATNRSLAGFLFAQCVFGYQVLLRP